MKEKDSTRAKFVVEDSTSRWLVWALAFTAAAVWIWCIIFQLFTKTSFLDDTFIYVHIANNVLETGTARYFPISGNASLLASSPLRLLVLIPATFIARLFSSPDRSMEAFRLTLVLYGLIGCAVFLPFYRKKIALWFAGAVFAGLICLSTESGLQMEGLLLFWILFTLLVSLTEYSNDPRFFRRLGVLVSLLILTRPEYGLVAFAFSLVYTLWFRKKRFLVSYGIPLLAFGAGWIAVAFLLRVYPIPTTYVTKMMTARLGLFSDGRFMNVFRSRVCDHFFFRTDLSPLLVSFLWWILLAALTTISQVYLAASLFVVASFLIVRMEAGNYLWYHENLYIVILTICFTVLLLKKPKKISWYHFPRSAVILAPLLLFFSNNIMQNRSMFWNFKAEHSRGLSYEAMGESYRGKGQFEFEGVGRCYLLIEEVGIVSYFAGPGAWLVDVSGLAQAGTLKGTKDLFFARLYPESLFPTGREEFLTILEKYGTPSGSIRLFHAYGDPGENDRDMCTMYYPETGVCLEELPWIPPSGDDNTSE